MRTIKSVAADKKTISFTTPLEFSHYGKLYRPTTDAPDSDVIDMRAAVGLLSRSVVVRGDNELDGWGAHIMALAGYVSRHAIARC